MKVFLSYRRDDTAGRAGRIADVFATRYGARNVFQDVDAAAPGLDFAERVDEAIVDSDVMLVVIGRGWLTSTSSDGGRRIDRADDFVRREVSAALDAGIRVVPVLVDGADLPSTDQLPDELAGMLRRQAVSVRDVSWHQDVDDLIRRLEGEEREPVGPHQRRWWAVAGVVAFAIVVGVIIVTTRNDDDGGSSSDGQVRPCPTIDSSWTTQEIVEADPVEVPTDDLATAQVQIVGASSRFVDGVGMVLVRMDVRNVTDPIDGTTTDEMYMGAGSIEGLLVDGIALPAIACLSAEGDQQMEPGERVVATIGFDMDVDPASASLTLEAFGDLDLPVTSAG